MVAEACTGNPDLTLGPAAQSVHQHTGGHGGEGWKKLMLVPSDYTDDSIMHAGTRALMEKITFDHGGPDYDARYPDGIPTSVLLTADDGTTHESGLVMYPAGHARNTTADLGDLLANKWKKLASLAVDEPQAIIDRFNSLPGLSAAQLASLYDFEIKGTDLFSATGK